jgi:hypothetical protein
VLQSREARLFTHLDPNDPTLYELNLPEMQAEMIAPVLNTAVDEISHLIIIYTTEAHRLDVNDELLLAILAEAVAAPWATPSYSTPKTGTCWS